MRILYIDTTTSNLYTAVYQDNKILDSISSSFGKDLSKVALDKIKDMLDGLNLTPKDIDKIIVVNGPGSFTGIRIGVTLAKTLAYTLNKDITTISSLQAMALSIKDSEEFIVPIIDARRGFVYAAIYDKDGNPILKDQYISLESLRQACDNLIGDYSFIGNDINFDLDYEEYSPNFLNIIEKYKDKENINPHLVNPIYLKLTEAEENKKQEII